MPSVAIGLTAARNSRLFAVEALLLTIMLGLRRSCRSCREVLRSRLFGRTSSGDLTLTMHPSYDQPAIAPSGPGLELVLPSSIHPVSRPVLWYDVQT